MKKDGRYIASRFFKTTGTLLEGVGFSAREARDDLKELTKHYREQLKSGNYLKGVIGVDGQVRTVARPNLALWLSVQNGKKANASK